MLYKIVFENIHFVIVDKAPNVLSVPSRMGKAEERPILGLILQKDLAMTLYPVHRLDFEVQGLIMFAKTAAAQKAGNSWFEQKDVEKIYCAITAANCEFKVGETKEWKCRLLRGKKRAYESPHGKDCLTIARLVSIDELGYFHWEMRPITGRSHQLRYELFRHGMAILGDTLYGSTGSFKSTGIALRAFKIDFLKVPNREEFLLPENITTDLF
jgi:tRNA pseudouridine32 synthase/23S rRNA pseudouridine746 synthase